MAIYKRRPVKVVSVGEKVGIEQEDGSSVSVRPKDIDVIHEGPVRRLADLATALAGELEEAWALLSGQGGCGLRELSELVYGQWTPATALAAWRLLDDGLYFQGTPANVEARSAEQVERTKAERRRKLEAEEEWRQYIERLRSGAFLPEDASRLTEIESLARGRTESSRALRELAITQSPEDAHALLLRIGRWTRFVNPHPVRLGLRLEPPADCPVVLPSAPRRDLTRLETYAIDDEGNKDPDDAISLDGDRLWIHVADPAACVVPDSEMDLEARSRAVTLYLPETTVPMFPLAMVKVFGLGLAEVSAALSFGVRLDDDGAIADIEIVPSLVKARRLTYAQAEALLDQEPFASLMALCVKRRARRIAAGAVEIELPEVRIRTASNEITIEQLPRFRSRSMVSECMLLAGEAASRFAIVNGIALPFVAQPPPDEPLEPVDNLAAMFQMCRRMKRNRTQTTPAPHAGLGLECYARVTSPLRRYADLLAHQQVRAFLAGGELLQADEVGARITATEAAVDAARRAEWLSDTHWTLAYLMERPGWSGEAVLVDQRGASNVFLIPSLDYETRINAATGLRLGDTAELTLSGVDLPFLASSFSVDFVGRRPQNLLTVVADKS